MTKISEKNINTPEYWDGVFQGEISRNRFRFEPDRFERITSLIADGMTVLDAGCGTGEFVKYLYDKKPRCLITGVDFSKTAIEVAKKNCPKCNFDVLDVMRISKSYIDYDCVVMLETLEHLDNPVDFVFSMTRTLKHGGLLILTIPYAHLVGSDEHVHIFNFKEMVSIFEKEPEWMLVSLTRYSDKLKNLMVVAIRK